MSKLRSHLGAFKRLVNTNYRARFLYRINKISVNSRVGIKDILSREVYLGLSA